MSPSEHVDREVWRAAHAWWQGKRPSGWRERQHRQDPTVNCAGASERRLARAVAARIVARWTRLYGPLDTREGR